MVLDGFFSATLGPVLALPNPLGILIVSFILTMLITLLYKYMTDQELMKSLKEEMKSMQNEIKKLKEEPEKMMKKQKEVMQKNMKYFMHSMKPNLISFIPIIFVFTWLRKYYTELGNPAILSIGGLNLSWLWTYIIFSIILSLVLRKVLKVH
ncbi:MAG: DUF2208 family protein [Candidatus Woesearchaeota archaeon]